jgi:hypothetical protein
MPQAGRQFQIDNVIYAWFGMLAPRTIETAASEETIAARPAAKHSTRKRATPPKPHS